MPGLSCNCETMQATCELGSGSSETLAMLVLCALSVVAVGKLFASYELEEYTDDEDTPPSGMFT